MFRQWDCITMVCASCLTVSLAKTTLSTTANCNWSLTTRSRKVYETAGLENDKQKLQDWKLRDEKFYGINWQMYMMDAVKFNFWPDCCYRFRPQFIIMFRHTQHHNSLLHLWETLQMVLYDWGYFLLLLLLVVVTIWTRVYLFFESTFLNDTVMLFCQ